MMKYAKKQWGLFIAGLTALTIGVSVTGFFVVRKIVGEVSQQQLMNENVIVEIPELNIKSPDQSERLYLSNINKIERSVKSLQKAYGNKYAFNIYFYAILALFFDLIALLVRLFIYYYEKDSSSGRGVKYEVPRESMEEEESRELVSVGNGKK